MVNNEYAAPPKCMNFLSGGGGKTKGTKCTLGCKSFTLIKFQNTLMLASSRYKCTYRFFHRAGDCLHKIVSNARTMWNRFGTDMEGWRKRFSMVQNSGLEIMRIIHIKSIAFFVYVTQYFSEISTIKISKRV